MQVIRESVESHAPNALKILELFLTNMHLFEPVDRKEMVKILKFIFLPRYMAEGRPPIEEEHLNSK
jgi:hypothetical protein